MSSLQLCRLTIAPRRGEGRALRFVASEVPHGPRSPPNAIIAKTGLLLSRGREDFSDFESSVLRLKSTHVADCKPQAPPGRRWDFALELGYGRFLQIKLGPAKSLALESGPRATFGKKHGFKIL